jgi:ubiquinone/menaquinone biosynthesis C-methylase UbiE
MNPDFAVLDPELIRRLNELWSQVNGLSVADREQVRYGDAAQATEPSLCCPVDYDARDLDHIPQRVLAVDYGCGDPTLYAEEGMTVLDLGSGSGKHAFMIARRVGPRGRVIGVDKTSEMLDLARGAVAEVTDALGYKQPNVEFRHGDIEDLHTDKDRLCAWLEDHEISSYDDLAALEAHLAEVPLVPSNSVDLVVSNCVLNLVDDRHKASLLKELHRVLKRGGSVAISDIVSDKDVPSNMKDDPALWTGCLSGAFRRDKFMEAFGEAGFHGMGEVKSYFWKRVANINFFSVTVRAYKGKQGPCYETYRSAMYRGPFSRVLDDDNHVYDRGTFVPVCEKTANLLEQDPYRGHFHVTPALEDPEKKLPFDCSGRVLDRGLTETQHQALNDSIDSGSCCEDDGSGCC